MRKKIMHETYELEILKQSSDKIYVTLLYIH
jgi:hypothetical protein